MSQILLQWSDKSTLGKLKSEAAINEMNGEGFQPSLKSGSPFSMN